MSSKDKRKLVASTSIYIDPVHCDSIISYKVIQGTIGTWASVQLSDCDKKIEWYFSKNEKDGLAKIDTVIKSLEQFRVDLSAAYKKRKRMNLESAKLRNAKKLAASK